MQTPDDRITAAATRPAADAKTTSTGGIVVDTPEGIERFRMITCLSGLKLESKGIRMTRGRTCLAIARRDYGITARTAADAYDKLRAVMVSRGIITE